MKEREHDFFNDIVLSHLYKDILRIVRFEDQTNLYESFSILNNPQGFSLINQARNNMFIDYFHFMSLVHNGVGDIMLNLLCGTNLKDDS